MENLVSADVKNAQKVHQQITVLKSFFERWMKEFTGAAPLIGLILLRKCILKKGVFFQFVATCVIDGKK